MAHRQTYPTEDLYHKYPVLKIPTGRRTELLIIGLEKAEAVLKHFSTIEAFVQKHRHVNHGEGENHGDRTA